VIDGALGHGGGQLLRSALALSMATGRGFEMTAIRAARKKPGLMRQHLTCVRAAAAVCGATALGAALGSTTLTFSPGPVMAGAYRFDIGSAGGTMLVLQALLPALARLEAPSTITLIGGTHNPLAPPAEFITDVLLPVLARIGLRATLRLVRHGFVPAGGGEIVVEIAAAAPWQRLVLHERGARRGASVRALLAGVPYDVGQREVAAVRAGLGWSEADVPAQIAQVESIGPGNAVLASVTYEHAGELTCGIGERGRPAEQVAAEAVRGLRDYLRCTAPVGEHLCDQLLVPLALAAGGEFTTTTWSPHAEAQRLLLGLFFGDVARPTRTEAGWRVEVDGVAGA
jgi:RNA 3'-terminal phosphate cyclase (ATP)